MLYLSVSHTVCLGAATAARLEPCEARARRTQMQIGNVVLFQLAACRVPDLQFALGIDEGE